MSVNCIVFMVDANDRPRFLEAKAELDVRVRAHCPMLLPFFLHPRVPSERQSPYGPSIHLSLQGLLSMEELQQVPFLILGNKVDMGTAAGEPELRDALGLTHMTTGKQNFSKDIRPVEIYMCSVVKKFGYAEGPHPHLAPHLQRTISYIMWPAACMSEESSHLCRLQVGVKFPVSVGAVPPHFFEQVDFCARPSSAAVRTSSTVGCSQELVAVRAQSIRGCDVHVARSSWDHVLEN